MKYYLIAGEASGDLHASNLMKELKLMDPKAIFRFWGGDLMLAKGGTCVTHYKEMAFMGFWEVIKNIKTLTGFIETCKKDIALFQPDAIILVDYAGFNLRIAAFTKSLGIPTHFYIAPKVWAWNEKRVAKLKKFVDHLYVIFPFEKPYFEEKHQYPVHYVGNPLQDVIQNRKPIDDDLFRKKYQLGRRPIIALLPGSRTQEINHILPLMVKMSDEFKDFQFAIAGAPNRDFEFYKPFIGQRNISFIPNKTYDLLSISYAALVTSGTATLETALFKIPQVVCYRSSAASYVIAKSLVKNLKYISLVNLVMDATVVTELIQKDFNFNRLKLELNKILDTTTRNAIFENYRLLEDKLGGEGASKNVAQNIYFELNK